eukprot:gene3596-6188_t
MSVINTGASEHEQSKDHNDQYLHHQKACKHVDQQDCNFHYTTLESSGHVRHQPNNVQQELQVPLLATSCYVQALDGLPGRINGANTYDQQLSKARPYLIWIECDVCSKPWLISEGDEYIRSHVITCADAGFSCIPMHSTPVAATATSSFSTTTAATTSSPTRAPMAAERCSSISTSSNIKSDCKNCNCSSLHCEAFTQPNIRPNGSPSPLVSSASSSMQTAILQSHGVKSGQHTKLELIPLHYRKPSSHMNSTQVMNILARRQWHAILKPKKFLRRDQIKLWKPSPISVSQIRTVRFGLTFY